jgi:sugar lactone lactonase YvrE
MSGVGAPSPGWVVPGGVVHLRGEAFEIKPGSIPVVTVGDVPARVLGASRRHIRFTVPAGAPGGLQAVRVEPGGIDAGTILVARLVASGLHQVDGPAFDGLGRMYVTRSGARGETVDVPLYRIGADGSREPLALDLPNPTSLALGPDGAMYVSSRFEGHVYRVDLDDRVEVYASDLGVPTGLAFSADGTLFVGDRGGSILRVGPDRKVDTFASIPPSVAAFHLAFGPDDCLYVSAPTLSAHDVVYRVTPDRLVDVVCGGFGRPQGLAFASDGHLYVAEALAGSAGVFRVDVTRPGAVPERVAASPVIVGLAFDPDGGLVLAGSDTAWRLDVPLTAAGFLTAARK